MSGIVGKRHDSMNLVKALAKTETSSANPTIKKVSQIMPKEFPLEGSMSTLGMQSPKTGSNNNNNAANGKAVGSLISNHNAPVTKPLKSSYVGSHSLSAPSKHLS